jgi:hypothetical protein
MATNKKDVVAGMEINDDTPTIEPVTAVKDFAQLASDEAFMNELVTVMVHQTTDENQAPHVIVNCNGTNQPIIRGVPTKVRRKYVEILAHMKETKYSQHLANPSVPDSIEMIARHGLAYPFDLIEDDNPRGRAWLTHVLAQPA